MENILEIKNLSKKYDSFTLDNLSFRLPKGAIMGFVGENGAGKTTTLKLILNLIRRDSGSVQLFGLDNIKEEKRIKENLGVVFDENCFHELFTVQDINRILKGVYKNWDEALFFQYMKDFGLTGKKIIKEFSRGMKMKLSIAAALSHHPKLLLLDEATSGLDPIVRNEILDIFLDFIQDEEHGILFSSHITGDLEKIADYVTFIHEGNLIFSKSKDELLYDYGILKCGTNDLTKINSADIVKSKKNAFGYEVLISNKRKNASKYKTFVLDNTTIEDIMLFYSGRERE